MIALTYALCVVGGIGLAFSVYLLTAWADRRSGYDPHTFHLDFGTPSLYHDLYEQITKEAALVERRSSGIR